MWLNPLEHLPQFITSLLLIISSIGVITLKKPVHSSLSFLLTLLMLASLYIQLHAEFIGVMQVLVYAGAILVIFMFVIILFQDAHAKLELVKAKTGKGVLWVAGMSFLGAMGYFINQLRGEGLKEGGVAKDFGTVQELGKALYIDFFFPFEAVTFLFLVAIIGALYLGKKDKGSESI